MSNFNRKITEGERVSVKIAEACVSRGDIDTDALGLCWCILLDFIQDGKQRCFLFHYDDEMLKTDVPLQELLQEYLEATCDALKTCLCIESSIPILEEKSGIGNLRLLVAGSDIEERRAVKDAFSLLSQNDVMFKPTTDVDLLPLYRQLAHRTIILELVIKELPDGEEAVGFKTGTALYFPKFGSVELVLMEINLLASPLTSNRWQRQLASIEEFQRNALLEENARLPEVLSLIPSNALYAR